MVTRSASPESDDDLADWLRLALIPGLGAAGQRSVLAAFGLPGQVFSASRRQLAAVVGEALADRLREVAAFNGCDSRPHGAVAKVNKSFQAPRSARPDQ